MTSENILEVFDANSTVLTNTTVSTAPFGPLNVTALRENLSFDAFNLTTSASPPQSNTFRAIADINAAVTSAYGENPTFHNATSISSNLTDAVTTSLVQQEISSVPESSSRVSETSTTEPGHVDSTTANYQWTTPIPVVDKSSLTVGIAVGVTIAIIILVLAFVALFIYFRRKRLLRRKHPEEVVENPHYTLDRNSSIPKSFDITMHTGPMVRSHMNNNSTENLTKTNGKRKKDSAARPPIYKSTGKDSASKRKPLPPPKHLGYEDLYEKQQGGSCLGHTEETMGCGLKAWPTRNRAKDSAAGSTEALELMPVYTINNENASPDSAEGEMLRSAPLLESFHPQKKPSKRGSKIDPSEPVPGKDKDEEDEDEEMKTALLHKERAPSNLSLTRKQKTLSQTSESSA